MKKTFIRILSIALVVCLVVSCIPSASALTATASKTAKFDIVTCGDKIFWRTTKVSIKNNGTDLDQTLTIKNSSTNCTVGTKYITLSPGKSVSFNIKTYLGKAGETSIVVTSQLGGRVSCSVTVNDNSSIFRVG